MLSVGQTENPLAFLKKIRSANKTSVITYDYVVKLLDDNNRTIDSSIGMLVKNERSYLDSNSVTITGVLEDYYFSINNHYRSITVVSLDSLKKMMGPSWNEDQSTVVAIPDSIIAKYAKLKMETLQNGDYKIELDFDNMLYERVVLTIDKTSYRLKAMELESDDGPGYRQVYYIRNIRYKVVSGTLNINRFIVVNNNKAKPQKKYSGYTINTITN